jgi:hypothetical protein
VPITGLEGISGWGDIVMADVAAEEHPAELVTEKVYVPAGRLLTVVVKPEPPTDIFPGERRRVQAPLEGSPDSVTLPVETVQVGCDIVPMTGVVGLTG